MNPELTSHEVSCTRPDLRDRIVDVLVGELGPEDAARVEIESHCETCVSCRDEKASLQLVLGELKAAPPWAAGEVGEPAESSDRLSIDQRAEIFKSRVSRASSSQPSRTRSFAPAWLGMAAILVIAIGVLRLRNNDAAETLPHPMPAAAAREVASKNTVEPSPLEPQVSRTARVEPSRPAVVLPEAVLDELAHDDSERGGGSAVSAPAVAQPQAAPPAPPAAPAPRSAVTMADKKAGERGDAAETYAYGSVAPEKARASVPMEGRVAGGAAGGMIGGLPESKVERPASESLRSLGYASASTDLPRAERDADAGRARRSQEGQREPKDMTFEHQGTNPFVDATEDPTVTFGLDVDTASYTIARNYLNRGQLPPPAAVRVEEFVNAFPDAGKGDRAAGEDGSPFMLRIEGAPNPLHEGYHVVRVALRAREANARARKPAHLTFVIDVSGSMAMDNRLGLVKRSLSLLVDKLDERDTIGIVVYGTNGRRVLSPTSVTGRNRETILSIIRRLHSEGSTNLDEGLRLAYAMAQESYSRNANNRVILCTDGVANEGETEARALVERIQGAANRGIDMMALGFGMGNYNDALLQRLADEGNGQYAYIDDDAEARVFFLRNLANVLDVVARDAKAQVVWNPERVERYRLLGYEKRDLRDRDFRNDAVDAGEINSGHTVTALFEVRLRERERADRGDRGGELGTVRVRYKPDVRSAGTEFSREILASHLSRTYADSSEAFQVSFVAARFAEHLRDSYWVRDESLGSVAALADELSDEGAVGELTDLVHKAARLSGETDRIRR